MTDAVSKFMKPGIWRKVIVCLLAAVLLLSFAACGSKTVGEGQAEEELRQQLTNEDVTEIVIQGTLYLSAPAEVVGNKTITGDGKIKAEGEWAGEDAYLLNIASGTEVTLAGSVTVDADGACGGVYVSEGASLSVTEEATVCGAAKDHANVMAAGAVQISGGFLSGSKGNNVHVTGTLQQDGGQISGGYNNVYVAEGGSFVWNAGSNLQAENDGVLVAQGAELKVTAATAILKDAGKQGIHLEGSAVIDGVLITGCQENQIKVEKTAELVVNECTLSGSKGHGITNRGKMTMNSGDITGAASCGIVNTGALEVNGGGIRNNGNKGILVKNGGSLLIANENVAISGNVVGVAIEENATADISKARINSNTLNNISCFGELYIHDIMMGGSGSNCIATNYGGHVVAKNMEIISTNGNNGIYNINGSLVELTDCIISGTKTNAIRNLDADLVGTNVTISNCGGGISTGDYIFGEAGSVKITNLTTSGVSGSNVSTEAYCGGTIELTNANLGATGSNNLSIKGGHLILTDVTVDGNSETSKGTTHGILMDNGGKITANNVTIQNTKYSAIRNRGGYFEGNIVTMFNIGQHGISNASHGASKAPGHVFIKGLYTYCVGGKNIENNSKGGLVEIYDSVLCKTSDNSIANYNGSTIVSNTKLEGTVEKSDDYLYGFMITGGTVYAYDVEIGPCYRASIRTKGGNFEGTNITTKGGALFAWNGGGDITIDGLVTENVTNNNIQIDVNNASISITNGKLCGTNHNNIRLYKGVVTLKDTDITGHIENAKNQEVHAVMLTGGELNLENVTIHDSIRAGIRNKGGVVNGTNVTIKDVKTVGISFSGGTIDLNALTTENVGTENISADSGIIIISNSTFGKNKSGNSIAIKGANLTLTDSEILGTKGSAAHAIYITKGSVTAENLKISGTGGSGLRVAGGVSTVDNVTISDVGGSALQVNGGTLTVNGITTSGVGTNNISMYANATVTVNGYADGTASTFGATNAEKNSLSVTAGTLTLNNVNVQGASDGTAAVYTKGSTVTLNNSAVAGNVENNGTLTVTGGSVTGNVNNLGELTVGNVYVSGIVENNADMTITGGTVNGTVINNSVLSMVNATVNGSINNNSTLNVNKVYVSDELYSVNTINFVGSESAHTAEDPMLLTIPEASIKGGTVLVSFADKATAEALAKTFAVPEEYEQILGTSVYFDSVIEVYENTLRLYRDTNVYVAVVNGTNKYKTIEEAVTYAASVSNAETPATIQLIEDIYLGSTVTIPAGSNIVITDNGSAKLIKRDSTGSWATAASGAMFDVPAGATLTLKGTGTDTLILDGNKASIAAVSDVEWAIIRADGTVNIGAGVVLQNNLNTLGGGAVHLQSDANLYVTGGKFLNNASNNRAGAILAEGTSYADVQNATFEGNSADWQGGAICTIDTAELYVKNCTFTKNTAKSHGGAVQTYAKATIIDSTFTGNSSNTYGGAYNVGNTSQPIVVTGCTFTENSSSNNGGAVNTSGNVKNASFTNCAFNSNSTGAEGGAVNAGGKVAITGCTFTGNKATNGTSGAGGAIRAGGTVKVSDSTFTGNTAYKGGAVTVPGGGNLTLHNATFSGNSAQAEGKDVRLGGANSKIYLSGKVVAYVHNQNKSTVNVDGTLADGSNVEVFWQIGMNRIPAVAVQFDSASDATANEPYITLAQANAATHHLEYVNDTAILAEGAAPVARVNGNTYGTLEEAITAAAAASSADKAVTIEILRNIDLDATISIPANANIIITDNGTAKTILRSASWSGGSGAMFDVPAGATLTLKGTGTDTLILDGNKANVAAVEDVEWAIVRADGTVYIGSGVVLQNNKNALINAADAAYGGGGAVHLQSDANLYVTGGKFLNNEATSRAGAIFAEDTSYADVQNAVFEGNSAGDKGGAICTNNSAELYVKNCTFINNTAKSHGGAIQTYAKGTLIDCTFIGNSSGTYGGAYNMGSTAEPIVITGCTFTENSSTNNGGAVNVSGKVTTTITDCEFNSNTSAAGGGALSVNGTATVTGGSFTGNKSTKHGGAILAGGQLTVTGTQDNPVVFEKNTGSDSGAISAEKGGTVKVTYARFVENSVTGYGGAIGAWGGNVEATNSYFEGNSSKMSGGAILTFDGSTVTLTSCTFHKNASTTETWNQGGGAIAAWNGTTNINNCVFTENTTTKNGGAVHSQGTVIINGGSFSKNTAGSWGGAIAAWGGKLNADGATFTGNTATGESGGAVLGYNNGTLTFTNCGFEKNTAKKYGGALAAWDSTNNVSNCTFTENTASTNAGAIHVNKKGTLNVTGTYTFTGNTAAGKSNDFASDSGAKVSGITVENGLVVAAVPANMEIAEGGNAPADSSAE